MIISQNIQIDEEKYHENTLTNIFYMTKRFVIKQFKEKIIMTYFIHHNQNLYSVLKPKVENQI